MEVENSHTEARGPRWGARRGGDLLEDHDLGQEGLHEAAREVRLDRQITFLAVERELADQARELIDANPRGQSPDEKNVMDDPPRNSIAPAITS